MASDHNDIYLISPKDDFRTACQAMCSEFGYSMRELPNVDALLEGEPPSAKVVIFSAVHITKKNDIAGHVQVIRQMLIDCFIICVLAKTLDEDTAAFIKMSGADTVVLEDEAVRTSKVQFICSQTLSATYIPIKATELTPGVPITFDIYHLLPLRGKYLPCKSAGDVLDAEKIKKISEVGEMYIRRTSSKEFAKYASLYTDKSAAGLARRCRAQFLSLSSSYVDLIYHLTNRSEHASFQKGQELLKQSEEIATAMMSSLGGLDEAWQIINNSAVGTFGSVERAPAVAAYASVFGLLAGIEPISDIMTATLLSDLGLLYLDPKITHKIRKDAMNTFTVLERDEYEKHASISLDVALERKLPLSQDVRTIIACTHERIDGSGFPKKLKGKKVPLISELIQIAEIIDQGTALKMGRARIDHQAFKKALFAREVDSGKFSIELMSKLIKI